MEEKKFWDQMDDRKSKDTGMAMVLLLLILGHFLKLPLLYTAAIPVLVIAMVCPVVFKPLAFLWFGLAMLLGFIMSRIILSLIFFILVFPTGLIRRLMGKDSMGLKLWKKGKESVFKKREYTFVSEDIKNPF